MQDVPGDGLSIKEEEEIDPDSRLHISEEDKRSVIGVLDCYL